MVYELIKRAIEQQNEFMTIDIIKLQIEFFYTAKKLTLEQYNELLSIVDTQQTPTV